MSLAYFELARHSFSTRRRGAIGWCLGLFLLGLMTVMVWPSLKDTEALTSLSEGLPPELATSLGMSDLSTPAGYLMGNLYSLLVPVLLAIIGVAGVASTISGDEHDGKLEVPFTFAVSRRTLLLGRLTATVLVVVLASLATFAAIVLGRFFFSVDVSWNGLVAITLMMFLFACFHLSLAYLLAACGVSRGISFAVPLAILVGGYMLRSLVPLVEGLGDLTKLSPWEWALAGDPMAGDIPGWGVLLLTILSVLAVAAGTVVIGRRDIHAP